MPIMYELDIDYVFSYSIKNSTAANTNTEDLEKLAMNGLDERVRKKYC